MTNLIPFELFEAFDSKLSVALDRDHREDVEKLKLPISALTVWSSAQLPKIYFYEFKFKNAWEYHFNLESLEVGYKNQPKFSRSEYNKIIATLSNLITNRLQKNPNDTYRIYGTDEKMSELYLKVVRYIVQSRNLGDFVLTKLSSHASPTGDVYRPAYEIQKDTRTLRLKEMNENYL